MQQQENLWAENRRRDFHNESVQPPGPGTTNTVISPSLEGFNVWMVWPWAPRSDAKVESNLEDDPEAPNSRSSFWPELFSESALQGTDDLQALSAVESRDSLQQQPVAHALGRVQAQGGTLFYLSQPPTLQKLMQGHGAKGGIFVMNNPHWIFQPSIHQTTLIFSFPAILRHTQVSFWLD